MNKVLEFKDFVQNNRNYYIADLELNKNGYTYVHCHDFYEFFVVLKGEFIEHFNDTEVILSKRQLHVIKPQTCHYFVGSNLYQHNVLRNIAVEKNYFEQCLKNVGVENSQRIFRCFELDEFTYASYKMKTDLLLQFTNSEQINDYLFQSMLSDILISGLIQVNNNKDIPKWLQSTYDEFSHNKNFVEGLQQLIALSGKSQEHLTRSFKKYYGISPSEYINKLRLKEATHLLRTSDEKVINIVYDCGFNNIAYFNRLFKDRYGVSPREYRDTNQKIF